METLNHSSNCLGCETPTVCPGNICDDRAYIPLLTDSFFDGSLKPEDFIRIQIKDDAMEPTLRKGDLAIAKKISRFVTDSLYVVEIEGWPGLPKVRRLQIRANGKLLVMCDKKIYPDIEVNAMAPTGVKILGFVFWTVAVRGYAGVQLPG